MSLFVPLFLFSIALFIVKGFVIKAVEIKKFEEQENICEDNIDAKRFVI